MSTLKQILAKTNSTLSSFTAYVLLSPGSYEDVKITRPRIDTSKEDAPENANTGVWFDCTVEGKGTFQQRLAIPTESFKLTVEDGKVSTPHKSAQVLLYAMRTMDMLDLVEVDGEEAFVNPHDLVKRIRESEVTAQKIEVATNDYNPDAPRSEVRYWG